MISHAARPAEPNAQVVTVILSTFNGENFLVQQMDSLFAQSYPGIKILARDDGSTDSTPRILAETQLSARIECMTGGDHLGAARSFFALLKAAAATSTDYIAFCDQDDLWHPDKISRAIAALSTVRAGRPALYCSRLEIVDEKLSPLGFTVTPNRIGFGNALVENVCVGCTIVLNRAAVDLLCRNLPAKAIVHDWWCYLVISCFGEIIFDPDASIRYRQHGKNVFGVALGRFDRLKRNLRRFSETGEGRHWQSDQATEFMAAFGNRIPDRERRMLNDFVKAKSSMSARLTLARSNEIWRQKRMDDFLWRILILMNRY